MPSVKSISNDHPRWSELAEAVQADAVKLGYYKQAPRARFLGIDVTTLRVIEGLRAGNVSEAMLDRVGYALGWPDGAWRERLGEQAPASSTDPIRTASEIVLIQELLRRAQERQRAVG